MVLGFKSSIWKQTPEIFKPCSVPGRVFLCRLVLFGSQFSSECHVSVYLFGDLTSVMFPMIDGQKRRDFLLQWNEPERN